MSLINDALKRAGRAHPARAGRPADGPAMTPAPYQRPAQWPIVAVPLLLLGVLVVAVWFFQQALQTSRQAVLGAPADRVAARETEPPGRVMPLPVPDGQPVSSAPHSSTAALPAALATATTVVVAVAQPLAANTNTASPIAASTNSTPAAVPPPPKLKAIFFRLNDPTAMINSKTYSIGDRVGEARLIAITRESISLLCHGQTNVLTIE
jgi:hypothetical protein